MMDEEPADPWMEYRRLIREHMDEEFRQMGDRDHEFVEFLRKNIEHERSLTADQLIRESGCLPPDYPIPE